MPLILASDVGGTKTILAIYCLEDGKLQPVLTERYKSKEFKTFDDLLKNFFKTTKIITSNAVFGVPGPVLGNFCRTPNLPWVLDSNKLAKKFHFNKVKLVNDFYAFGNGVELLPEKDILQLNTAKPIEKKVRAFIGAGTGLGESIAMWWDGYHIYSSEGGHSDFAPRNDFEIELFNALRKKLSHVSVERVLSGRGLTVIYRFLNGQDIQLEEDLSIKIVTDAIKNKEETATKAVDAFVSIYGAEAGNLALRAKAISGVYVGGGIARTLFPDAKKKIFLQSFYDKGRLSYLMKKIPVSIVMNAEVGVLGAANYARKFFFNEFYPPSARPLDL